MVNHVVVLGSINVDTTYHVNRFPQPGETIAAQSKSSAPGGKGANQAVAAARSGAQTVFVGAVGSDNEGQYMLEALKENDIDTSHINIDKYHGTGSAAITLDANGQNDIMVYGGANQAMQPGEFGDLSELLAHTDFLIAQFETPQAVALDLFKQAKEQGVTTVLNPAPAHEIMPELLQYTDVIAPNETECALLTGIELTDEASMLKSADYFRERGVKHLLITLGDRGVFYATPNGHGLVPAFKVKAVDTTAAGDTFIGALCSQLEKDLANVEDSLRYAQRASSLTVQRMGAMPSIPTGEDVKAALKQE
ncbi:ribokinase [Limosilactobacillus antri]|uniref:Ribokinase n=1 Tax=Limosilactobacillus antri DSM 16041 TaxID=525309 RepID=C8P9E7_9LACO|nr:ribokinase [Limosilactobacillus antri]EEW52859.1 ribokinase [Limosilactobacillus antri DSM 16041]KRK60282.1 ribokinase [Limosilactobacillus antri DSM 16041]